MSDPFNLSGMSPSELKRAGDRLRAWCEDLKAGRVQVGEAREICPGAIVQATSKTGFVIIYADETRSYTRQQ